MAWTVGCAGPDGREPAAGRSGDTPAEAVERVVRGYLVLDEEVRSLKPCGEERELAIDGHELLREAYALLSRGEGGPVFVEVLASRTTPAERDGEEALTVRALRRAAPAEEGFGCGEDISGFAFRASGVEPFWSIHVRPDGLTYTTPELPRTLFESDEPRRDGDGWVYEASSSGPEPISLRLELRPTPCSDSMVGAIYSWSARVDIAGAVHDGCAWEGALAPRR